MELFDKKFVHFMWEESLEGKEGFFADDICELTNCVLGGNLHYAKVRKSLSPAFPFKDTNNNDWLFFYYDPNYEVKKAYMAGKQVQYSGDDKIWVDWECGSAPNWDSIWQFCVKPESNRMTYRQLAEWLAKGNGEYKSAKSAFNAIYKAYPENKKNKELTDDYKLRRWGSDEWIEPTVDVYNADVKGEE